jgi:hypothetical protein
MYCFISNNSPKIETTQCLGYDWKKNAMFKTINIPINHRIHNQFFLKIILGMDIST